MPVYSSVENEMAQKGRKTAGKEGKESSSHPQELRATSSRECSALDHFKMRKDKKMSSCLKRKQGLSNDLRAIIIFLNHCSHCVKRFGLQVLKYSQ